MARARIDPVTAREILNACGGMAPDYHALSRSHVDSLLAYADSHGYRKPRNANGSRARYFHAYLTRQARNAWKLDALAHQAARRSKRKESTHA